MKAVIVFLLASLPVQAGLAEVTAIRGARIHTGLGGEVIENGTLLIRDGVITAVGTDLAVPAEARLIEAAGSEITPGLV
ncbi:MAG: amidohydrolase, partial [Steroidobacteraceae bacterium]